MNLINIHIKEFYREPGILFWAFIFPIATAWVLGVAFDPDRTEQIRVGIIEAQQKPLLPDEQKTLPAAGVDNLSNMLNRIKKKQNDTRFSFIYLSRENGMLQLKRNQIAFLIDFDANGDLQYRYDKSNTNARLAQLLFSDLASTKSSTQKVVAVKGAGFRYIDFLLPGLIAMGIMNSVVWGVGFGLIELRMRKLLRRMIATPMSKAAFLLSGSISRLLINFAETLLLTVFSILVFDIELQGSVTALILIIVAGNLAFSGISVFLASRASNTRIGNGLVNAVTMPMMVLSGIFFSYANFPEAVIPVLQYLPLTLLADGVREIFNEGAGVEDIMQYVIILTGTGAAFFAAGIRVFRWY